MSNINWKELKANDGSLGSSRKKSNVQVSSSSSEQSDEINNNQEMQRLENFVPESPHRSLEDVILPQHTLTMVHSALNKVRFHKKLYEEWNLIKVDPHGQGVAINLFGPPGTGKTLCAEAIANELQKRIINVNYAEIESKYVGETPKNIMAAFKKAHETNSILFFDEADSILGKRLTNVTQSSDYSVNVTRSVMLLQLDQHEGIVIFASNLPQNYDGAFIRRIFTHIEFELPDQQCRVALWNHLMPAELPRNHDVTPETLAEKSEGLSGGDILNAVKLAASNAVARTGENCKVFLADIYNAIEQIRNSKRQVGSSISENRDESSFRRLVTPEELPPDIRKSYDQFVDKK